MAEEKQAIILIRFSAKVYQAARNSLTKQRSVTESYGGEDMVIAICSPDQMEVDGRDFPAEKGLALLTFPTTEKANQWITSVPEIKQYDWLQGDFEMILFEGAGVFDPDCLAMTMLMFELNEGKTYADVEKAFEDILPGMFTAMEAYGMNNLMAHCPEQHLRGNWKTHNFYLSQCANMEKLREFEKQESMVAARAAREKLGKCTTVLFELEKLKKPTQQSTS